MRPAVADRDTLTAELDALAVIGRSLAGLPDEAARTRVLRWALERFPPEAPIAQASALADCGITAPDPTLVVDSLEEFFDGGAPRESNVEATPGTQSVESLVKGFVTDFRRLMIEWQGA